MSPQELRSQQALFRSHILAFPEQLHPGAVSGHNLENLRRQTEQGRPDALIVCGMGGSATPGSILQNILNYAIINLPVLVWRDQGIPAHPFKNPLYLFISFSGNTRETLSAYRQARRKQSLIAIVAGGGTLLAEAQKNDLPYCTFKAPSSLQPRQGYGFTLYGALTVIKTVFPRLTLPDLRNRIKIERFAQSAERIVARVQGKTVLVYTTLAHQHLGQVFKISINESGKALAFANTIPEANHNELNLFEKRRNDIYALFVTTQKEHKKRAGEFRLTKGVLDEYGIASETIAMPGETPLEIVAYGIGYAQWLGYACACSNDSDPLGLEIVNLLKKRAAKMFSL